MAKKAKGYMKNQPLLVAWTDCYGGPGWELRTNCFCLPEIITVGLFVKQTKDALVVAAGAHPEDDTMIMAPTVIPLVVIKYIKKLEVK